MNDTASKTKWKILAFSIAFLSIVVIVFADYCLKNRSFPINRDSHLTIGTQRFTQDHFGGVSVANLETGVLPYKILKTALILNQCANLKTECTLEQWPIIMRDFGILTPTQITYADGLNAQWNQSELGLVRTQIISLIPPISFEGMNLGCALCHSGVAYDQNGLPKIETATLGSPSTSFNPEMFISKSHTALSLATSDPVRTMEYVKKFFPEIGIWETLTLRHLILPLLQKRLKEISEGSGKPFLFSSGGPGLTNGVASLKHQLKVSQLNLKTSTFGYTSIPETADRSFRSSFLYDGLYSTLKRPSSEEMNSSNHLPINEMASIVAFFMVPTMGTLPENIPPTFSSVEDVIRDTLGPHRPQKFPGQIDEKLAKDGEKIYVDQCQSCHGTYSRIEQNRELRLISYPNKMIPIEEIKSDPERIHCVDDELTLAINQHNYSKHLRLNKNKGYIATILTGLWSSAPYLHNGSVPTLWHL
ncbi:MAG: hypothetical protein NT027_02495, partial [Proteobacteria bacterium]|nr:hypothetical protein [Pseudomonadota bacterium]